MKYRAAPGNMAAREITPDAVHVENTSEVVLLASSLSRGCIAPGECRGLKELTPGSLSERFSFHSSGLSVMLLEGEVRKKLL